MKTTLAVLLTVGIIIPAGWAGSTRRGGQEVRPLNAQGRQAGSMRMGARKAGTNAATVKDAAPPPAPGVIQVHMEEGQVFAYFVATSPIPAQSTFGGGITIYQGSTAASQLLFDNLTFDALNPGDFVNLPQLSNLGDLWPAGVVNYTVDVTIRGTLTEANGNIFSGVALGFSDIPNFTPIISGTSQKIASNKDMTLVINGTFTTDTPLVAIENFVPPASAITRVSGSEIDVDLSKVPNIDLTAMTEYLLTVSQAGFSDTVVYRYVPAQPGSFNPAPQQ